MLHSRLKGIYEEDTGELPHNIPTIADLPPSADAPVLLRVDLDIAVAQGVITDSTRVEAVLPTIIELRQRGYRPILFGHVGRSPDNTARPIAQAFAQRLSGELVFISDWLDPETWLATDEAARAVQTASPNTLIVLENTRKYALERVLWKERPTAQLSEQLGRAAASIVNAMSPIYVNDAIAANNFDFSTCVLPLASRDRFLGKFYASELPWISKAQGADAIIISGLKANKLDDIERIIERTRPSLIMVGGSLASSLYKARSGLTGPAVSIGVVETDSNHPAYVAPDRQRQAERIVQICLERKIELKLPVDFILDDGSQSDSIPHDRAQYDIGPETARIFGEALHAYADHHANGTIFYNGVLGMFEDQRFQTGTVKLVAELNHLYDQGIQVYVGGGEGRLAMQRFGDLNRVTHAFTAGGTILKAVARRPIWPLSALVE